MSSISQLKANTRVGHDFHGDVVDESKLINQGNEIYSLDNLVDLTIIDN